jgi:UDP-glucose 4-epimerase
MNLLLTGGIGHFGRHTAVVLSELGHKIDPYDNPSNSSSSVLENRHKLLGK